MKEDYIVVEHAVKKYKDTIALNGMLFSFVEFNDCIHLT